MDDSRRVCVETRKIEHMKLNVAAQAKTTFSATVGKNNTFSEPRRLSSVSGVPYGFQEMFEGNVLIFLSFFF